MIVVYSEKVMYNKAKWCESNTIKKSQTKTKCEGNT